MTIIVWDGKTLAADKQMTNGGLKHKATKIFKIDGHLVGVTGDFDYAQAMLEWFRNGAKPESFPDHQKEDSKFVGMLVITPNKQILKYERSPYPIDFTECGVTCIGSGRDYAYGALYMGATAYRAVEAACQYDTHCGMGIDVLTLD